MPPRERILHVFARLEEQSGPPSFHGCLFDGAAVRAVMRAEPLGGVALRAAERLLAA